MNRIAILITLFIFTQAGMAQDEIRYNTIYYPTTEVLAMETHASIVHSLEAKDDSLYYHIGKLESIIGRNETTERVKILNDLINDRFQAINFTYYYKYFISIYLYRINYAKKANYQEIYDEYKSYLNYNPLNSEFDQLTVSIASALLAKQEYGSEEYIICLLLSNNSEQFNDLTRGSGYKSSKVKSTYINSPYVYRKSEGFFKFYAGHWLPLGNLKENFHSSINLGFSLGIPVKLKYRSEIKIQVAIDPNKSKLDFRFDDSLYSTSSVAMVNFGFKFIKEHKLSKQVFFDTSAEINVNSITTNIKNPNGDEKNSTHSVETVDVGIGFGIKKFVGEYNAIGIETVLHATPYGLNGKLVSDSGVFSLSTSLFYSF